MRRTAVSRQIIVAVVVGALSAAVAGGAETSSSRPLRIDDIFEIEGIGTYYGGPYAFSPDGRAVAFTRVRAKKTLQNHKWEYLWGNAGADVWLQRAPGEKPVNLTNGVGDGSGWWAPQWSPDGRRLAMLSTRGGNVGLWVSQLDGTEPRRLTDRGVDLVDVRERPFLWVDDLRLLCPVLPEGEQPMGMRVELHTPEIATREWAKTPKGTEVTASVLESGIPVDLSKRPQGRLVLIDASTGSSQVLVGHNTAAWQLAPGGRAVAFARQVGIYTPKADEPLRFATAGTFTAEMRRLDGAPVRPDRPLPKDVLKDSLRWSPDGKELAFFAFRENRANAPNVYRVDAATGRVLEIGLGDLDAEPVIRLLPQLEWTSTGDLLLLAARREKGQRPGVTARRDWWLVSRDGSKRCLTEQMKSPPPELWPQEGRASFVGLAGGPQEGYGKPSRTPGEDDIWRIRPKEGTLENLTAGFEPRVAQIAWPMLSNNGDDEYPHAGRTYSRLVLGVQKGEAQDYWLLNLKSGEIEALKKPSDNAELKTFDARGSVIYSAGGKQGTFIWRTSDGEAGPRS